MLYEVITLRCPSPLWFSLSVGEALNEDQDHARAADLDRVVSDALWRLRTTEPDNATLWCELGRTMNHGGVFDLGFECIETAYRLAPGDPKILRVITSYSIHYTKLYDG